MEKNLDTTSDEQLWALVKESNRLAFNELFNRYWKKLYSFTYGTFRNHELSEDAIQEVFTSLWDKRGDLEIRNVKAYLYQAVRFQLAANIRKVQFSELHIATIDKIRYVMDVEEKINYEELHQKLQQILDELPDRCREIFYMSRFQHFSNQEIADKLNISKRTVENQLSRALQKISTSIETTFICFLLFFQLL